MSYDALNIARYIVDYSFSTKHSVTNLRLQKTLYFVQAEFLVSKGNACFDNDIYAWNLGPVVPEVYREYKVYGGAAIPSNGIGNKEYGIAIDDSKIINDMVDQCNKYSSSTLVQFTHEQKPWLDAYHSPTSRLISSKAIKEYFDEVNRNEN